ncbi:MAG: DNA recombination protein RmuC, partial [Delftia sp.]|nr:DNA recombination protein RmuC [Delftia sp.]
MLLLGQAAVIWLLCRRSAQRDDGVAPQQLLQALQMLDVRLQQLERGAQATQMAVAKSDGGLDRVSQQLQAHLAQAQLDAQAARREQGEALAAFRMELGRLTVRLAADSAQAREAQGESTQRFNAHVQERFEALAQTTRSTLDSLKNDIQQQLGGLAQS